MKIDQALFGATAWPKLVLLNTPSALGDNDLNYLFSLN